MTRAAYEAVREKYDSVLLSHDDDYEVLCFVRDLLEAEVTHLKATEPYATNTIHRLECAAHDVYELSGYTCGEFPEEVK